MDSVQQIATQSHFLEHHTHTYVCMRAQTHTQCACTHIIFLFCVSVCNLHSVISVLPHSIFLSTYLPPLFHPPPPCHPRIPSSPSSQVAEKLKKAEEYHSLGEDLGGWLGEKEGEADQVLPVKELSSGALLAQAEKAKVRLCVCVCVHACMRHQKGMTMCPKTSKHPYLS